MTPDDPTDATIDIAPCLAVEVMYANDEGPSGETPEQRWEKMWGWVARRRTA